jgi:hypothetical protein
MIGVPAAAQERRWLEFELGTGFGMGGGSEDVAPSTGMGSFGVTVWPAPGFGLGVVRVVGLGYELRNDFVDSIDRVFLGAGGLEYLRVALRLRRPVAPGVTAVFGVGMVTVGKFSTVALLKRPLDRPRVDMGTTWLGFGTEMYVDSRLTRWFSLRGGVTFDFNGETSVFQPVALAVVGF